MGLSTFTFVQWAPKDASFLRQRAFWPFKVDDFGTNRKRICDFLLVINSNFGPILQHFRDRATYWLKIAYFSFPNLIRSPRSLPRFPLEFRAEVNHEETRVMVLSYSADPMIVAWVVLTQCQRVTDSRTVGQTDGFTIASTALCWRAVNIDENVKITSSGGTVEHQSGYWTWL